MTSVYRRSVSAWIKPWGGVFRSVGRHVNPILGEVGKIAATTGSKLAEGLISDAIEGKDLKESARERGKEAGKQSLNLGTKRVIQEIQGPPKATSKARPKATKRSRSQSGGPKKRKKSKRSQKGGKRKKTQKGGFAPFLMQQLMQGMGAKSGSTKRKRTAGVVFPRAMTQKQRRSLPPKDIFG